MFKNRILSALSVLIFCLFCYSSLSAEPVKWSGLTKQNKEDKAYKYFMHTGFMLDAVLRTSVFSYNLMSPVIAETEFDIIYLDKVIIPKYTKFIGYADIVKSADRVNVVFHTVVFPDGTEIRFNGMGLSTDGSAGIHGKVKKYKEKIPVKVILGAVANTTENTIGGNIAKELSGEALKEIQEYTPTYSISVQKGIPIIIYNTERIMY